jgi:hypothetical protein
MACQWLEWPGEQLTAMAGQRLQLASKWPPGHQTKTL